MLIQPGEHSHLSHLLTLMLLGEQMAHDCAQAQIALAPEQGMQTFLSGQARQEGYHAFVFGWAIRWLTPRLKNLSPFSDHMNQYRQLLESAIARRDFAETLVAEQIILEGLGEAVLKKVEIGLVKRGAPFQRLRQTLIHQEEAHHQFGLRVLCHMVERDEESYASLQQRTTAYLSLAKTLLFSAQETFYSIDEDPQEYWDGFHQHLPRWLQPDVHTLAQPLPTHYAMV